LSNFYSKFSTTGASHGLSATAVLFINIEFHMAFRRALVRAMTLNETTASLHDDERDLFAIAKFLVNTFNGMS